MWTDLVSGALAALPGGAVSVLLAVALVKKDQRCDALTAQLMDIAKQSAVGDAQVVAAIDGLRDAIRQGTRT